MQVPASMCNRHGLIAGATGTGKTKTLQLMAEQLSAIGVPGVRRRHQGRPLRPAASRARPNDRVTDARHRARRRVDAGGHPGDVPLARRPRARRARARHGVVVRPAAPRQGARRQRHADVVARRWCSDYADKAGLALLDLADLRAVLQYLTSDDGKAELKGIGGLSSATAGVLLRKIVELEQQGAEAFFGEPELDTADLLRTTPRRQGRHQLPRAAPRCRTSPSCSRRS